MFATGRIPHVKDLGLEHAGVELNDEGAIQVDPHSKTTAANIWAIGDVTDRMNLTPVAIREAVADPDLTADLQHGYFLQPTVLADATMEMTVAQQEIFGPVAVVIPFDDEAEAISMANNNRYGLGAGVWTRDIARGHRVASRIVAGMVWVNDHHRLEPSLPWGGVKESGTGKDAGTESFDDFSWIKTVVVRTADDHVDWYGDTEQQRLN